MLKITISHAVAQSVKLTLFEGLIEETIESTRHIPRKMAKDGKIRMSRKAINQKIGQVRLMFQCLTLSAFYHENQCQFGVKRFGYSRDFLE